jgi:ethanolamine utilization protein EutA
VTISEGRNRTAERFAARARSSDERDLALTSIGVDVGSATTHLLISRLRLALVGARYSLVEAQTLYQSPISLTRYESEDLIDERALRQWLDGQLSAAGVTAATIDTGAVLMTGRALLARNAAAISRLVAGAAGTLVAVGADHHLEAALAARGSGAAVLSGRSQKPVLNVDVGGGTTKFALCQGGRVEQTAALNVGARTIEMDAAGRIVRIDDAARSMNGELPPEARVGNVLGEGDRRHVGSLLASQVIEVARTGRAAPAHDQLMLTSPIDLPDSPMTLTFSGGVAEYVHGREVGDFGDIGAALGAGLRDQVEMAALHGSLELVELPQGIRATALGASRHTVQVSGHTVFVAPEDVLPLRAILVVEADPDALAGRFSRASIAAEIGRSLDRMPTVNVSGGLIAIALQWQGQASRARLEDLCAGLLEAHRARSLDSPIVVVVDRDVAGILGVHLASIGASRVVALDGLVVSELDRLDIGELVPGTGAVPVVVTTPLLLAEQT